MAIILGLGAVVIGSSYALFTDQDTIAGNTVATGSFELTLNHTEGKPFSITDAFPGFVSPMEYMDLFNSGSMPLEAHLTIEQTAGDPTLYSALNILLVSAGGDSVCESGDFGEFVIWDGPIEDFPASTLVSDSAYWHLANEDDASGPNDNIRPGYTMRICQQVSVDPDAGNEIMGTSATFSEIVDAVQDND